MHAVSQGALGIQCRSNDLLVIQMVNELNHEDTLLRIIAERTLLAKLEGGCSAPVGVISKITNSSICLEGCVLDQEGTQRLQDRFEIKFDSSLVASDCPIASFMRHAELINFNSTDIDNHLSDFNKKRKLDEETNENKTMKHLKTNAEQEQGVNMDEVMQFSFIVDLKISETKMAKAELCGMHLAEKLKEQGADVIIRECKAQTLMKS